MTRGPALLLASLFAALSCASPAFAADEVVERDGETLLIRTYTAASNVPRDDVIEQRITHADVSYTIRDVQVTELPQREKKQVATKVVKIESDTDAPEQLAALFEPEIVHEVDGFSGTLVLDPDSIEAEAGEAVPYSYAITDEQRYCGLERDDPALVPKTAEKNGVILGLTGIEWTRTEEPDGSVWYAAAASYAGTASGTAAGKYTVHATYSGEVTMLVDGGVAYKVTYGPAALPETVQETVTSIAPAEADSSEPEIAPLPVPPEPPENPTGWKPVLVIGVPAVLLLGGVAVAILKRKQIGEALRGLRKHPEADDEDDELFPVNQGGGKMRIPRAMQCMERATDEGGNE